MIEYHSGDLIEIIVRDGSMRKIENWRCNFDDKKNVNRIFRILKEKYGFSPSIFPNKQVHNKEKKELDILDIEMNL
jgi:hypothetical protein